jgi:glycosyltransferase involved in cell wall biosynthesis
MAATLWIDVEDLFEYAAENTRPSGIQRLAYEIYRELHMARDAACTIRFVRHATSGAGFCDVAWPSIEALFADLTDRKLAPTALHGKRLAPITGQGRLQKLLRPLPPRLRPAMGEVAGAAVALARALRHLLSAAVTGRAKSGVAMPQAAAEQVQTMQPGDVIMVLGSPWSFRDYDQLIRRHRDEFGTRFALLVYDLIPIRRPEFCDVYLVQRFTEWLLPMLPLCDQVFAISQSSAADFEAFAADRGIDLQDQVRTIPIGTTVMAPASIAAVGAVGSGRVLPRPGSYALIVSTIEARKNHLLLFRVWRRLLEDLPADQVPVLVFAGRIGWLVDDLMRQISNTGNLGGKLIVWESPTDAELSALYSGCLFTLFPSLYEGWGLPVTESLAAGKPCLTSNTTSMPEAGAGLTRMFDPDNLHDAYRTIRAMIEDRAGLAAWEAQIKRDFRPVPWSASARALLDGLFPPEVKTGAEMAGLCEG